MSVYAISDLHLSFGVNKPMNVFGAQWNHYEEKIKADWCTRVKADDVVIIPGDVSWGMTLKEALPDFLFIDQLPGKKLYMRGNHDYYFSTKTRLERFFAENAIHSIQILSNNAYETDSYIVCGARGWSKTETKDSALNEKIIAREEIRLRLSLEEAKKLASDNPLLVAMHFPPFIANFQSIMQEYNVQKCIYGHLHGYGHQQIKQGNIQGIEYIMVSCDYTDFKLTLL